MSNAYTELAQIFKERDNVSKIGVVVGRVVNVSDYDIASVDLGNGIIIDSSTFTRSNTVARLHFYVSDLVIVLANEQNNHFYLIDKVG